MRNFNRPTTSSKTTALALSSLALFGAGCAEKKTNPSETLKSNPQVIGQAATTLIPRVIPPSRRKTTKQLEANPGPGVVDRRQDFVDTGLSNFARHIIKERREKGCQQASQDVQNARFPLYINKGGQVYQIDLSYDSAKEAFVGSQTLDMPERTFANNRAFYGFFEGQQRLLIGETSSADPVINPNGQDDITLDLPDDVAAPKPLSGC